MDETTDPAAVTAEQFWAWPRDRQRQFLDGASIRKAAAVGVAAICGGCGEPLRPREENHQCDPEHLAEALARLRAMTWPPQTPAHGQTHAENP